MERDLIIDAGVYFEIKNRILRILSVGSGLMAIMLRYLPQV
jgi:hypothetical protein